MAVAHRFRGAGDLDLDGAAEAGAAVGIGHGFFSCCWGRRSGAKRRV